MHRRGSSPVHHPLPIECRGDAFIALAAGGNESRDRRHEDERAQRIGIARGNARRRRPGAQGARRRARTLDVGVPQPRANQSSAGPSVSTSAVAGRWRRPLAWSSRCSAVVDAGTPDQRTERHREAMARQRTRAPPIARPSGGSAHPHAKPGDGEEQAGGGGQRRQRRPQALPEDRPARPAQRRRQRRAGGFSAAMPWGSGVLETISVNPISAAESSARQHRNTRAGSRHPVGTNW